MGAGGSHACSKGAGEAAAAAVRQRQRSGQVPGGPLGENTPIGQHGARWAGPSAQVA